ncbi:MAG: SAM-dependent methyltransferase [Anaerolineaceae bacterium]|nr:SAM-dependent methyltransferase [Anaerolineaceae bacterium]
MDTTALKKFAQEARKQLIREVQARLQQVLLTDSVERHQKAVLIEELQKRIQQTSREQVIEAVAYTWFNRLCALRYMDLNGFNRIGVVSPASGATQPEILQEAKGGYIEETLQVDRKQVLGLLSNTHPADNPQQEAYRLLLVAVCNQLAGPMPFLFTKIEDTTQLLMPVDLLSGSSILNQVRQVLTPEACQDVEVIGWLYQFYISDKKDEVMGRKSAVPTEDIPAVTQLFTPHWIVQYMVENSLGRLWLLNHPESRLIEKMAYYIKPIEQEAEYIHLSSPEEIRLCDPACGSGHILTYAFDLLYAIYEEMGYDPVQIPALILKHNLYGIEIDQRAGSLAAFALYMKAYEKDRRLTRRNVKPNICVMENITFSAAELKTYMEKLGSDLFTQDLWEGLKQFEDATTFGSLIRPRVRNPQAIRERMQERGVFNDLFLYETNRKVEKVLEMVTYLSPRYQVVVANPPYFGNFETNFKKFAKDNYPDSKSDTFAMFIERGFDLIQNLGFNAMVTMQSWMFLSSYEELRKKLLHTVTIDCMVHMANMVMGIAFGTAATVWRKNYLPEYKGDYSYVNYEDLSEANRPKEFPVKNERLTKASAADFNKIPGSPIAYWVSDRVREVFMEGVNLRSIITIKQGMATSNNERFVRNWSEVSYGNIAFNCSSLEESEQRYEKWYPYNKGGPYKKWYGNNLLLVNWHNNGKELKKFQSQLNQGWHVRLKSREYYFLESLTWSSLTSGSLSVRYSNKGYIFDTKGNCIFSNKVDRKEIVLGLLNSIVAKNIMSFLAPTLDFNVYVLAMFPFIDSTFYSYLLPNVKKLIEFSKKDWDSYETSWDFERISLLKTVKQYLNLKDAYTALRQEWLKTILEMQQLEEENNRIFIKAYGLQDELTPEVPLSEITLTCNPHYRYPDTKSRKISEAEREARLLEDTMKEFLSYAVGCMFGRYSLDKPGLILANQGETVADYLNKVGTTTPTFTPDEDNVTPVLDGDWFPDDITNRFKSFLKITFGEENYEDNLSFIENALGKDLRSYFVRDFYKDHVQTYKKRPIYWLFSSPKGSFNALIYMHRYRPDTVSVLLNKYLREYQNKLRARREYLDSVERSPGASKKDKVDAQKESRQIDSTLLELRDYESEIIYPLATEQISIDLDDGVKVNYAKFGKALKGI